MAEEDPLATETPTFEAERQPHTHSPSEFDWFDQFVGELNSPLAGDPLPPSLPIGPFKGPESSLSGFQHCGSLGLEGPAARLPGVFHPLPHMDEVIAFAEEEAFPQMVDPFGYHGDVTAEEALEDACAWLLDG